MRALVVSTDDKVYISRDDGQNWQPAALGLPRRPHCGDLRFVRDEEGGANLYLGTYGRSVWVAELLPQNQSAPTCRAPGEAAVDRRSWGVQQVHWPRRDEIRPLLRSRP